MIYDYDMKLFETYTLPESIKELKTGFKLEKSDDEYMINEGYTLSKIDFLQSDEVEQCVYIKANKIWKKDGVTFVFLQKPWHKIKSKVARYNLISDDNHHVLITYNSKDFYQLTA